MVVITHPWFNRFRRCLNLKLFSPFIWFVALNFFEPFGENSNEKRTLVLPQALEIIFEVERKRSNEKTRRRKQSFLAYKTLLFSSFFFSFVIEGQHCNSIFPSFFGATNSSWHLNLWNVINSLTFLGLVLHIVESMM